MRKELQSIYLVASGEVDEPSIEVECDGVSKKFTGRDARLVCTGILVGVKAERDNLNLSVENLVK